MAMDERGWTREVAGPGKGLAGPEVPERVISIPSGDHMPSREGSVSSSS